MISVWKHQIQFYVKNTERIYTDTYGNKTEYSVRSSPKEHNMKFIKEKIFCPW